MKENIETFKEGLKAKEEITVAIYDILRNNDTYSEFFGVRSNPEPSNIWIMGDDVIEIETEYRRYGETYFDHLYIPIKYITDESALKEAIQKVKEEKERKRIAEEEANRQKEIENEKKKQNKEYQQNTKIIKEH